MVSRGAFLKGAAPASYAASWHACRPECSCCRCSRSPWRSHLDSNAQRADQPYIGRRGPGCRPCQSKKSSHEQVGIPHIRRKPLSAKLRSSSEATEEGHSHVLWREIRLPTSPMLFQKRWPVAKQRMGTSRQGCLSLHSQYGVGCHFYQLPQSAGV